MNTQSLIELVNEYNETVEAHNVLSLARGRNPNRTTEERDAERSFLASVLASAAKIGTIDVRDVYEIDATGVVYRVDGERKRVATLAANPYRFVDYFGRTDRHASYLLNVGDRLIVVQIPR